MGENSRKDRFSIKSTVPAIYKNYLKNGSVDDAKTSGRSSKLTQKDQNWLRRIGKKNNQASLEKRRVLFNSSSKKTVSKRTTRRNLHKMDLVGRAAAKKLRIRAETRVIRLLWAKKTLQDRGGVVVFSDSCKFSLKSDGPVYV